MAKANPPKGFTGFDFEYFPFISGYGCLYRTMRINELTSSDFNSMYGIRVIKNLDLMKSTVKQSIPRRNYERAIGIQDSLIAWYWDEENWLPIDLRGRWHEVSHPIRHCPKCAAYGYHCAYFQLPTLKKCPWHETEIISACPACGIPFKQYLEPGDIIGLCHCGHDLFDISIAILGMKSFPAKSVDILSGYILNWAEGMRQKRYLAALPIPGYWIQALDALCDIPGNGFDLNSRSRPRIWNFSRLYRSMPLGHFHNWTLIGSYPSIQLARLPKILFNPMCKIVNIFNKKFKISIKFPNVYGVYGLDKNSLKRDFDNNHGLSFTNSTQLLTEESWVHLSIISEPAINYIDELISSVVMALVPVAAPSGIKSPSARKSDSLDFLIGNRVLSCALNHLIIRGFSHGLYVVAQASEYNHKSAKIKYPVAEITGNTNELISIRICWVDIE